MHVNRYHTLHTGSHKSTNAFHEFLGKVFRMSQNELNDVLKNENELRESGHIVGDECDFKCVRCGGDANFAAFENHTEWKENTIADQYVGYLHRKGMCPKCYAAWLRESMLDYQRSRSVL